MLVVIVGVLVIYLFATQTYQPTAPAGPAAVPEGGQAQPAGTPLPFDEETKTVMFTLITTNGFEYNGTSYGELKVYVPEGSKLRVTYINQDKLPHSAGLMKPNKDKPTSPQVNQDGEVLAATPSGQEFYFGLNPGEQGTFETDPLSKGTYWIVCGVPGHAASGQWIVVNAGNYDTPFYTVGK